MSGNKVVKSRSRRPFVILGIIFLLIGLSGLLYWLSVRGTATTDDAEIDGNIHMISPRIAGQIVRMLVTDNQHVVAGQELVELDPRDAQISLEKAQADQAQAAARLEVAQSDAAQATANVVVADAALVQAQQDYRRYATANPGAVPRQEMDTATQTLRSAEARYHSAKQQAAGAKASVDAAVAAVQGAQVEVDNARLQLSYTRITAPAAGTIATRTARVGNFVAAGQGLMAVVGDTMWVTANYKETQLGGIKPGAPATIAIDAVPGVTFKGHVEGIQRGTGSVFSLLPAENATGNYVKIVQRVPVKIAFDNDDYQHYVLALGMSVEPSIRIK